METETKRPTPRCRWCLKERDPRHSICGICKDWQKRARDASGWFWCTYMEEGDGCGSLVLGVDEAGITVVLDYEPCLHILRAGRHDEDIIERFASALPDLDNVVTQALIEREVLSVKFGVEPDQLSVYRDDGEWWYLRLPTGVHYLDAATCRREALVLALELGDS